MVILPLALFLQNAEACGPSVSAETLAAVARTESKFNTLAIGDNTTGRAYAPATLEQAVAVANRLLAQRHSVDLGLMQINSANLRGLGITVADTFDACKSIAGGARVLVAGYQAPGVGFDTQPALLRAISRYNTGHPERGFRNGYVRRVQLAAQEVVPAIRVAGVPVGSAAAVAQGAALPAPPAPPPGPPSWDVYGQARYRRDNGGPMGAPVPTPAPAALSPMPASVPAETGPVLMQAEEGPAGAP